MGLTDQYREDIEELESSIEESLISEKRAFEAKKKWLDSFFTASFDTSFISSVTDDWNGGFC